MITETPTIRLHVEADPSDSFASENNTGKIAIPGIHSLVELFPQITGWEIDTRGEWRSRSGVRSLASAHATWPSQNGEHIDQEAGSFGRLRIVDMWKDWPDGRHCASRQQCDSMVSVFNSMIAEIQSAYQQVEELNAQLATSVPLFTGSNPDSILLSRLQNVIREGIHVLNVTAGGLYLLDEATRELHLRVQVGLSGQSLLRPPRRLRDSIADLDALVGHPFAISGSGPVLHEMANSHSNSGWPVSGDSLEDDREAAIDSQKRSFRAPEDFPAALCVPVATHSTPLGTLWFFSAKDRPFSNQDISIAGLVGGRMASELERESAVREGATSHKLARDFDRAKIWQQLQTPPQLPAIDGWEIKGQQILDEGVGGAIVDYSISSAGELVAAVGDIQGAIFESSLAASTMRGAMRTLENSNFEAARLLFEINNTMWNCPLGDQIGSLFAIRLDPSTGIANWSNAGETSALIVGRGSESGIVAATSPLGACPDELFEATSRVILPESTLFAFNDGFRRLFRYSFRTSSDHDILEHLQNETILMPNDFQAWIEELTAGFDSYRSTPDISFVAIHRSAEDSVIT